MSEAERTVITVEIAGEEYTVRSDATPDYTRECARYVDETIAEIMERGSLVEAHKAAILAAMALTDQLFQSRESADELRSRLAERSDQLLREIEEKAPSGDLASPE